MSIVPPGDLLHQNNDSAQLPAARDPVYPNVALAKHGFHMMDATLSLWWKRACKRHRCKSSIYDDLNRIIRHDTGRPTGELLTWLRSYDWEGDSLSTQEARQWIYVRNSERQTTQAMRLPAHSGTRNIRRPRIPERYWVGARLYKKVGSLVRLRDE